MAQDVSTEFSPRKARTVARLAAYCLLLLFLISVLAAVLGSIGTDPARAIALITEILERSTLPLVATVFLVAGFCGDVVPALWECRLALWLRPLLRLVALLYLLSALAVVGLLPRIERARVETLESQLQRGQQGLAALRQGVERVDNAALLRRLLAANPQLLSSFEAEGGTDPQEPLQAQRARADKLLERAEINLRRDYQRSRADITFGLARQAVRLALTAFVYALYYLLVVQIWPRSLAATVERVRALRARREAE